MYKCPEGLLKYIFQGINFFLKDLRSRERNFSKKNGYRPGDKRFRPDSSRIIGCYKPQGTILKGPQGILTITGEVIRSFL